MSINLKTAGVKHFGTLRVMRRLLACALLLLAGCSNRMDIKGEQPAFTEADAAELCADSIVNYEQLDEPTARIQNFCDELIDRSWSQPQD